MTESQGEQGPTPAVALDLRPGSGAALDAVLAQVVGPLVDQLAPAAFRFVRWHDQAGAAVRLELHGTDPERALAAASEGLDALQAPSGPAPDGLLPAPSSWQVGGRAGVQRLADPARAVTAPDAASAQLALVAAGELSSGPERFALVLAAFEAVADGLQPAERARLWSRTAARWTGEGERGDRVAAVLATRADKLAGDLRAAAASLREDPRFSGALDALAQGSRGRGEDALQALLHLTANRLGASPLEEALLALVAGRDAVGPAAAAAQGAPTSGAPAGEDDAVIELEHVTRDGAEEDPEVDDVSLEVRAGEVFGLLGPEGAGTDSLLGIAAGLRVATAGQVRVLGHDPREEREALRGELGVPLPHSELAGHLTPRENLELRARVLGVTAVDAVLELAGLREQAGVPLDDLDPGARRRVGMAAGLLEAPAVLFLDRPTDGLAPLEREAVWALLRRRSEQGDTTILTTSSVQEATDVCDRAALVVGGGVVAVGPGAQLAEDHFPERVLRFQVTGTPDRAALEDLPDVLGIELEERPDHWACRLKALQPDELLKLLAADPDFPRIVDVTEEDLDATFLRPARPFTPADRSAA